LADDSNTIGGKVFKAEQASVLGKLGLVVGKAMVFTEHGRDYYDLQGDHIPKDVGVPAMIDFALNARTHKIMHQGAEVGKFCGLFPITKETCDALGIKADWEGIAVAIQPDSETLAKFASGEFTGFSIGGSCSYNEED
jgi:hypothetical protein